MVERIVTIRNRAGMHARPAALLDRLVWVCSTEVFTRKSASPGRAPWAAKTVVPAPPNRKTTMSAISAKVEKAKR